MSGICFRLPSSCLMRLKVGPGQQETCPDAAGGPPGVWQRGCPCLVKSTTRSYFSLQKRASKSEFHRNTQWVFKLVEPNEDTGKRKECTGGYSCWDHSRREQRRGARRGGQQRKQRIAAELRVTVSFYLISLAVNFSKLI